MVAGAESGRRPQVNPDNKGFKVSIVKTPQGERLERPEETFQRLDPVRNGFVGSTQKEVIARYFSPKRHR